MTADGRLSGARRGRAALRASEITAGDRSSLYTCGEAVPTEHTCHVHPAAHLQGVNSMLCELYKLNNM